MTDYFSTYANFDLAAARSVLIGTDESGFNAAVECCDRWCGTERPALYWEGQQGDEAIVSFDELRDRSGRLANFLVAQGIGPGDRVAGLQPRTPELLVTMLAVWRLGAVYQPLFTAFGPKAIEHRLNSAGTRLVIVDPRFRAKLDDVESPAKLVVTDRSAETQPGDLDLSVELAQMDDRFEPVPRPADSPFLIMFTSGTTGAAKPLLVPLRAITAFVGYMRHAIDLRAEDRFWNLADPGWAYGLYYAVVGPLAMGNATLFFDGPFTVESSVDVIRKYGVTNLAGAPTAYRLLVGAGPDAVAPIRGQVRVVSSAGEPLNPEVIRWFDEHLDVPIHDHYGQTELGMVVCNHHALAHPIHPGSAGMPVPGHRVVVVDEESRELPPGVPGTLAVDRTASPLFWFSGYGATEQPEDASRYYLSGDTVELGEDGSITFVGRSDDVITSSGYRIGPFDVESALLEHPAVLESAVVGKPDPERTEIVKAFVVLQPACTPSPALADALKQHVRHRLSAHAYPREVEFIAELPKTPSGKIQRFLLRNREARA